MHVASRRRGLMRLMRRHTSVHALQLATMVKDQALAATKLLAKAPGILKEVDDAVIFKNHAAREIPSFEPNGA